MQQIILQEVQEKEFRTWKVCWLYIEQEKDPGGAGMEERKMLQTSKSHRLQLHLKESKSGLEKISMGGGIQQDMAEDTQDLPTKEQGRGVEKEGKGCVVGGLVQGRREDMMRLIR